MLYDIFGDLMRRKKQALHDWLENAIDRSNYNLLYLKVNKLCSAIIKIKFLFNLKIFITFVFTYKVNNCKNVYDVLRIKKDATDTEIKKSYKKLALVLHPDENHAPEAAEAFKSM